MLSDRLGREIDLRGLLHLLQDFVRLRERLCGT